MNNDLGYAGENTAVITDAIDDIIGATSAGRLGDAFGESVEDLGDESSATKVRGADFDLVK